MFSSSGDKPISAHDLVNRQAKTQSQKEKSNENEIPLKQQVLQYIQSKGPAVPVQIAQELGRESYLIGAVLSELLETKQVIMSHAKIGGSRMYYTQGQEAKLSTLYKHLPETEKKAYNILKEKKYVNESEVPPAIRVALNMISDFSIQIPPERNNGEKGWRWYLSPPAEIQPKKMEVVQKKAKIEQQTIITKKPEEKQTKKTVKEDDFSLKMESFLSLNKIKIIDRGVVRKNMESNYVVKISSQIGELNMFVCAKNKKKINDKDLMLAHQKGQNKKMLTLFLATGEITKKAQDYLEKNLEGYMIYRKI
tara:strand:- start:1455 stop:2378 length:924 start_codon:yes stop_codon:yes gene_type:complete